MLLGLSLGEEEDVLSKVSLKWMSPIYSPGGYSSESLSVGMALDKYAPELGSLSMQHHGDSINTDHVENKLSSAERGFLQRRGMGNRINNIERGDITTRVVVCHSEPGAWHAPLPRYNTQRCPPEKEADGVKTINVGRTMFETDSCPDGWVSRLNYMDYVWVPTAFQAEIFEKAGVVPAKIQIVGEGVDTDFYKPTSGSQDGDNVSSGKVQEALLKAEKPLLDSLRQYRYRGFTLFLFVGKWEERKGVSLLLKAFYEEFGADEKALLLVLTSAYHSASDFDRQVDKILREEGLIDDDDGESKDEDEGESDSVKKRKKVLLLTELSQYAMPQLYSLASALVIPSRGEGWGRPHVESMACGTPVIATNWSGPTAYLTPKNGYPLAVERMVSASSAGWHGHEWAQPSLSSLRALMRRVFTHPDEALYKGRRARNDMLENFSLEVIATEIKSQLERIAATAGASLLGEGEL